MADAQKYGALVPLKLGGLPAPYDPPADAVPPDMGIRPGVRAGLLILLLFFGVLGGWAAFVPLSSAAIAPGVVGPDSNRKTIQHLEGGVVSDILVKNGDAVEAGQVLVRLAGTQSSAAYEQFRARHRAATALEARLIAERDGLAFVQAQSAWFHGIEERVVEQVGIGDPQDPSVGVDPEGGHLLEAEGEVEVAVRQVGRPPAATPLAAAVVAEPGKGEHIPLESRSVRPGGRPGAVRFHLACSAGGVADVAALEPPAVPPPLGQGEPGEQDQCDEHPADPTPTTR